MKNMIIIIIILLIIFIGMVIYKNKNSDNRNSNIVTVEEVQNIEQYISKIYMWKEVTNEALPQFDDINNAEDLWTWEVIKKNLEEQEAEYKDIQNVLNNIFGNNIKKELPKEGNSSFIYDEKSGKYISSGINLDNKQDKFLLNNIKKTNTGYAVEIIEYIEDHEQAENLEKLEENSEYEIIIRNLQGTEIAKIKNTENQTNINEFIKSNSDQFSKKEINLKKDKEQKLYVEKIVKGDVLF